MNQHSHHPHQQQHPAHGAPQQPALAGGAPWPSAQSPGAPLQQPQFMPALPTVQQFQYAGAGYVSPGTPGGHAPMSAFGGTIGSAAVPGEQHDTMPLLNHGHAMAPQMQYAPASPAPAAGPLVARPQAWAFPTPQGLQMVQPGAPQMAPAHAQPPLPRLTPIPGGGAHGQTVRRVRWETIVPAAALVCFLAAVALFFADFDRMTGRDTAADAGQTTRAEQAPEPSAAASTEAPAPDPAVTKQTIQDAAALMKRGRFSEASAMLHPLLQVGSPDPAVVALHDRIDAASTRNTALLKRLASQRLARQWTAAVTTIGELQKLRPLSPALVRQRTQALAMVRSDRAITRARALMSQGRYSAASTVVEAALEAGPNKRLEALREQLAALRASPSKVQTASPTASGGGGQRASGPPPSGGRPPTTAARPPANVGPGTLPPRPDAPNPTTTGAGSVTPSMPQTAHPDGHDHTG